MVARQALQQDRGLLDERDVKLDLSEAGAWGGKRGVGQADVWKAGHLLGRDAEDFGGGIAEVAELRVADRHRLLAQATQCLAVLLGKLATLLGALSLGAGETAWEILPLRGRRGRLRSSRGCLGPRCAHACIVAPCLARRTVSRDMSRWSDQAVGSNVVAHSCTVGRDRVPIITISAADPVLSGV